jgi:hypothetical protein
MLWSDLVLPTLAMLTQASARLTQWLRIVADISSIL